MLREEDISLFTDLIHFRPNVGCIFVQKSTGLVLVGRRNSSTHSACWQFPQGGVDVTVDDTLAQALRREMLEELGIKSFDILNRTSASIKYKFPEELQSTYPSKCHLITNSTSTIFYQGQEQIWYLATLDGHPEPSLELAIDKEFVELDWVSPQQILHLIVPFKRNTYELVLKEFGLI